MANSKFWLQVRKDYIFENFDNLLQYLRSYKYNDDEDNSDFDDTLMCMNELVAEIGEAIGAAPFFDIPDIKGYEEEKVVKLMLATVLASSKAGKISYNALLVLCELLTKLKIDLDFDALTRIYGVIINCLRRSRLVSPGYSWNDICSADINISMLAIKVSNMTFVGSNAETYKFLENKGLFLLPPTGHPILTTVSLGNYVKSKSYDMIELPGLVKIKTESGCSLKGADFNELYKVTSRLLSSMAPFKKTEVKSEIKEYDLNDEFVVRITMINYPVVVAETIDQEYKSISGKVYINPSQMRPLFSNFYNDMKVGDYLIVMLSEDESFKFEIEASFENIYRIHSSTYHNQIREAKYLMSYKNGDQWVTEDGVRVGIDKSKISQLDEEKARIYNDAKIAKSPIYVKFYSAAPDIEADNFYMYADPLIEEWRMMDLKDFHIKDADIAMIRKYLEESAYAASDYEEREEVKYETLDANECASLIPVLFRIIEGGVPSSKLKLEYQTVLAMLCNICDHPREYLFIDHDRRFLNSQVQFVSNHPVPELDHPLILDGNKDVERKEELVRTLLKYNPTKNIQTLDIEDAITEDAEKSEKVTALVEASNNLAGIIDNIEQNNIKQYIARTLDIEDEYVSILNDRTFYGTESISLEFKTSAVYPPANRRRFSTLAADPDMQKWAIIKAVCGFLNTRSGGELLIGVKDTGYASGVEEDIRVLAEKHLIMAPTVDQYRTYLQAILDYAFKAYKSTVSSTDIARSSIEYLPEINEEGKTVMRVKIKPFPRNVVMLAAKDSERPVGIEESYVRLSGRTVPVTKTIREQILRYKE